MTCWLARRWNGLFFFFSSRRRHTRCSRDWSSDVCSSDLTALSEKRRTELPIAQVRSQQQNAARCRLCRQEMLPAVQFAKHVVNALPGFVAKKVNEFEGEILKQSFANFLCLCPVAVERRQEILNDGFATRASDRPVSFGEAQAQSGGCGWRKFARGREAGLPKSGTIKTRRSWGLCRPGLGFIVLIPKSAFHENFPPHRQQEDR